MIQFDDLESFVGKFVFYAKLNFSNGSFRAIGIVKPQIVKVVEIIKRNNNYKLIRINDIKDSPYFTLTLTRYGIEKEISKSGFLFETEKESKEWFNKMILIQLDKLQSYYETKKKYLNKKIIQI